MDLVVSGNPVPLRRNYKADNSSFSQTPLELVSAWSLKVGRTSTDPSRFDE